MAYKNRRFHSETLLGFLDLPLLDPIYEAMPLKLKLEQIKSDLEKAKEQNQEISQLHLDEIKEWIEAPITSYMRIDLFLQEWGKVEKRGIGSLICKVELHLEHSQYHDIKDLLDVFSKWQSTLGKA